MDKYNSPQCTQCGKCCKAIPCGMGLVLLGDYRPCRALELSDDGKHYCGLILHASHYIDLGENTGWKDEFISDLVATYNMVGKGCGEYLPLEVMKKDIQKHLLKKLTHLGVSNA